MGEGARESGKRYEDRRWRISDGGYIFQFYGLAKRAKILATLRSQLIRAASSIALNLAEGWGRATTKDRLRFYTIAMGSIRECQAIIDLERTAFQKPTVDLLDHLGASTYKLIHNTPLTLATNSCHTAPLPLCHVPQNTMIRLIPH